MWNAALSISIFSLTKHHRSDVLSSILKRWKALDGVRATTFIFIRSTKGKGSERAMRAASAVDSSTVYIRHKFASLRLIRRAEF